MFIRVAMTCLVGLALTSDSALAQFVPVAPGCGCNEQPAFGQFGIPPQSFAPQSFAPMGIGPTGIERHKLVYRERFSSHPGMTYRSNLRMHSRTRGNWRAPSMFGVPTMSMGQPFTPDFYSVPEAGFSQPQWVPSPTTPVVPSPTVVPQQGAMVIPYGYPSVAGPVMAAPPISSYQSGQYIMPGTAVPTPSTVPSPYGPTGSSSNDWVPVGRRPETANGQPVEHQEEAQKPTSGEGALQTSQAPISVIQTRLYYR